MVKVIWEEEDIKGGVKYGTSGKQEIWMIAALGDHKYSPVSLNDGLVALPEGLTKGALAAWLNQMEEQLPISLLARET